MPHARFDQLMCPWPGCAFQVWFVDFCLESHDQLLYEQGIRAWEEGPGLIGCCPSCGQRVLFSRTGKTSFKEGVPVEGAVFLPGDWFERAILLGPDGNVINLP